MRPVNKPAPPSEFDLETLDPSERDPLTVLRLQLQDTIGYYCSFCEMPINVNQAVTSKYVRKLRRMPTRQTWGELLLACDFCQFHRTQDVTDLSRYLWPDTDATFSLGATSPLVYTLKDVNYIIKRQQTLVGDSSTKSLVIVSANPAGPDPPRAQRTIDLFQLNTPFYDAVTNTFTISEVELQSGADTRVDLRTQAWTIAGTAIETLRDAQSLPDYPIYLRNATAMSAGLAQLTGFWSVWMTTMWQAFSDSALIKAMLIETSTLQGYQVIGYQTVPDGGSPPWTIFTGTAVSRVAL